MKGDGRAVSAENNVASFLLDGKAPNNTALLLPGNEYTYGDLQSATAKVSAYLCGLGARKGDRVILASANGFFWAAAYLGVLRAGLICVPLPDTISREDLDFIVGTTGANIACLQARISARQAPSFHGSFVLTDRPAPPISGAASQEDFSTLLSESSGAHSPAATVGKQDLAALMFTSGSTGKPRGVMVSHGNIIANTESIIQYLELTSSDRIMTVLPFHYCFGTSLLHTHLRVGGSLVLDSRFLYPEVILQHMLETECTGFAGVPSHFQILLRNSGLQKKCFPHLRYVQQAGGCLAPHFVRELQQTLPTTKVFVMYGQTEATARLSYLPPELLERKSGSVGKGIPGVRLRVLGATGEAVRPGEVGEIVAEGDNVTQGYWGAPEESAAILRDGKLHTGDMATLDEGGFIYIVDRKKSFLKCGGKRVGLQEIENRLLEFPCVVETAVVALPDAVLGEAVCAFVVPRMPGCREFDQCIRAFYKENLPRELCPRKIVTVERIPRNSSGKVSRHDIESLWTSSTNQQGDASKAPEQIE